MQVVPVQLLHCSGFQVVDVLVVDVDVVVMPKAWDQVRSGGWLWVDFEAADDAQEISVFARRWDLHDSVFEQHRHRKRYPQLGLVPVEGVSVGSTQRSERGWGWGQVHQNLWKPMANLINGRQWGSHSHGASMIDS